MAVRRRALEKAAPQGRSPPWIRLARIRSGGAGTAALKPPRTRKVSRRDGRGAGRSQDSVQREGGRQHAEDDDELGQVAERGPGHHHDEHGGRQRQREAHAQHRTGEAERERERGDRQRHHHTLERDQRPEEEPRGARGGRTRHLGLAGRSRSRRGPVLAEPRSQGRRKRRNRNPVCDDRQFVDDRVGNGPVRKGHLDDDERLPDDVHGGAWVEVPGGQVLDRGRPKAADHQERDDDATQHHRQVRVVHQAPHVGFVLEVVEERRVHRVASEEDDRAAIPAEEGLDAVRRHGNLKEVLGANRGELEPAAHHQEDQAREREHDSEAPGARQQPGRQGDRRDREHKRCRGHDGRLLGEVGPQRQHRLLDCDLTEQHGGEQLQHLEGPEQHHHEPVRELGAVREQVGCLPAHVRVRVDVAVRQHDVRDEHGGDPGHRSDPGKGDQPDPAHAREMEGEDEEAKAEVVVEGDVQPFAQRGPAARHWRRGRFLLCTSVRKWSWTCHLTVNLDVILLAALHLVYRLLQLFKGTPFHEAF
mmetsp:Transcript_21157/g.60184  ORF Transcript_21157/g.60184 Transcript_21157/m.60184 type:complete len:532 (+) Transcript_21157:63-1658(+)